MDKIIDMIAGWDRLGQCLFLSFLAFMVVAGIVDVCKYLAVIIRGWPPEPVYEEAPEELEEEEGEK